MAILSLFLLLRLILIIPGITYALDGKEPCPLKLSAKQSPMCCSVQRARPLVVLRKAHSVAIRSGGFGALAGSVQVLSLMWLRTIVNYQYRYGVSAVDAAAALYQEGGIPRFYRGMSFALIQNPLLKFGAVAANEGSKVIVRQLFRDDRYSAIWTSTLGTCFSIVWKLFLFPLETVKTVLQVDGSLGFEHLCSEVGKGNVARLFAGCGATVLSTVLSHYPWFYVHNLLDSKLPKANTTQTVICRSAVIGFIASAVSDTLSNAVRVVKTLKQTLDTPADFWAVLRILYNEHGLVGLVGRGLATRIIANAIQSVVFVIAWKLLPYYFQSWKSRKAVDKSDGGD